MVEEKIENMVMGEDVNEDIQVRIKKLEKQEEIRERKEKRDNIVIEGWEVRKIDSLEIAVKEMLQKELHAEVKDRSILDKKRNKLYCTVS